MNRFGFVALVLLSQVLAGCGPVTPTTPTGGGSSGVGGGFFGTGGGFSTSGGGSSGTGGGTSGTGGGTSGTGGGTSGTGGGSSSATWAIAECEAAMDKFANANCADRQSWLGFKAQCQRLPSPNSTALCETPLSRAKACHAQFISQGTVFCNGPNTDTNETCGADVVLGILCAATVNAGPCAGVACMYNSDCPSGWSCNDQTRRCFQTSARCPGLPCKYNADCPTGLTCNNATGQCNAN